LRDLFMRENLVFISTIYLEPVQRFRNMNNAMKFGSFGDYTSSRVENKVKRIGLSGR